MKSMVPYRSNLWSLLSWLCDLEVNYAHDLLYGLSKCKDVIITFFVVLFPPT